MVTLALGAIGVINIMLVAVSERTHEIGLRKALGATNRSILFQFFLEGLLLTLGSGLIGMGLAAGLMAMLGTVQGPGGFDPPKLVPDVGHAGDWQPDPGGSGRRTVSRAQGGHAAAGGSAPAGVRKFVIGQSGNFEMVQAEAAAKPKKTSQLPGRRKLPNYPIAKLPNDLICFVICSAKPTAPCGTTAAALPSPCWAWRGASPRWSCCWLMEMASARPAPISSPISAPS